MFPWAMGATPIGGTSVPELYRRALRRLEGDGYPQTDESVHGGMLYARGAVAGMGGQAIRRAFENAFGHLAVEALDEQERERLLRNDSARSPLERQQRLAAIARIGTTVRLPELLRALRTLDPSATFHRNTSDDLDADDAEALLAFQTLFAVDDVAIDDQAARTALEEVARRALPVRSWGQHAHPDPRACFGSGYEALYNSPATFLDREAIRQNEGAAIVRWVGGAGPAWPAHLVSYGPLTILRSEDLNRIQDSLLWSNARTNTDPFSSASSGGGWIFFSAEVASLATATIDTSRDWRDRMCWIIGRETDGSPDIRPGQANDNQLNDNAVANEIDLFWYTQFNATDTTTNWTFAADGSGHLTVKNETVGTRVLVCLVQAAGPTGEH